MYLQHLCGWCHVKLLHAVFFCVPTMVWLPVPVFVIFNVCPDVMHLIAHRGLSGHHESLQWKSTGRKTHCCTRDSNPCQYCTWLFSQRMLYQLSYPCPNILLVICQSWLCCRASACEATWRSLFRLLAQNITWDVLIG